MSPPKQHPARVQHHALLVDVWPGCLDLSYRIEMCDVYIVRHLPALVLGPGGEDVTVLESPVQYFLPGAGHDENNSRKNTTSDDLHHLSPTGDPFRPVPFVPRDSGSVEQ